MSTRMSELWTCLVGWIAFWIFLFKVYYKEHTKNYNMNGRHPANDHVYKYLAILIPGYAMLHDQTEEATLLYRYFIASFTISFQIVDSMHYERGKTNLVWPFHHFLVSLCAFPVFCSNQWQYHSLSLFCVYEVGSYFFTLQWAFDGKLHNAAKLVFVIIYTFTRMAVICMLCWLHFPAMQQMKPYQDLDYFWHAFWAGLHIVILTLNAYLAYKSFTRICRKSFVKTQ